VEEFAEGALGAAGDVALLGEGQPQHQVHLQIFLQVGLVLEVHAGGEDVEQPPLSVTLE
jgi:hypothetical protein